VQRFEVAAFETGEHLVYVVSDLSRQDNRDMMLALARDLKEVLGKV